MSEKRKVSYSFCTACRDRLEYVQRCLHRSLEIMPADSEYVLLDYNSPDGTFEWAMTTFSISVNLGRLKVYRALNFDRFLTPHAKNIVHLLGTRHVLVNMDVDNYLTPHYIQQLEAIDWDVTPVATAAGTGYEHGCRGRLAMRADIFRQMGGYNEQLNHGWGYDEIDFEERLRLSGHKMTALALQLPCYYDNTPAERAKPLLPGTATPKDSNAKNKAISRAAIRRREYVANRGQRFGAAKVYDHTGIVWDAGSAI